MLIKVKARQLIPLTHPTLTLHKKTLTGKEVRLPDQPRSQMSPCSPFHTQIELDIDSSDKVFISFSPQRTVHPDTVLQITRIKEKVEEQSGVPPQQQRLIFGGRQMYLSSIVHSRQGLTLFQARRQDG